MNISLPFSRRTLSLCGTLVAMMMSSLTAAPVHCVSDLAHGFSFYTDGRFARQYLPEGKDARNWGNLYNVDASNVNLIALLGCDPRVRYNEKDLTYLKQFMSEGGCVLLAANPRDAGQQELAQEFGFRAAIDSQTPYQLNSPLPPAAEVDGQYHHHLKLDKPEDWQVLIQDVDGKPIAATLAVGKGQLLVLARSLMGTQPNGRDNINHQWIRPLLEWATAGKNVDATKPMPQLSFAQMGNKVDLDGIAFHYPDYVADSFNCMKDIYLKCHPLIEARMGVPLSEGMGGSIGLLSTDGGGFSSGSFVGLAVFWENFPKVQHGMYEFLTHEFVHSWVLPHPEVWNEPIATYVGDLVMADGGYAEEGYRRIENTIKRASKIDPSMKLYDIEGRSSAEGARELNDGERNEIHWGKTFWVFEQLRKEKPDFMAKYFQAKRKYVPAKLASPYSMDDTVAIMSIAMGRDMFPWFNEHGMPCNRDKVQLKNLP